KSSSPQSAKRINVNTPPNSAKKIARKYTPSYPEGTRVNPPYRTPIQANTGTIENILITTVRPLDCSGKEI
ncbi:hypothetical protein, partial [Pseudomonas aeruginosa]|uniref:hypothetical protein n=1 Tax=Pseudomonas aeruginosa TaxID=287 RepID=UPI0031B7303B